MDRYAEMQTFVRVAESGSLSATAERMNIAKSAVSRRLADLESRLGVQLLHRTTRRISLTDSGRGFFIQAQRLLAELEEAEQSLAREHAIDPARFIRESVRAEFVEAQPFDKLRANGIHV